VGSVTASPGNLPIDPQAMMDCVSNPRVGAR
jgi:hypothetical protein